MASSKDTEKTPDRIQHLFTMKNTHKMGTEGTHLDITKATWCKPTACIILNKLFLEDQERNKDTQLSPLPPNAKVPKG